MTCATTISPGTIIFVEADDTDQSMDQDTSVKWEATKRSLLGLAEAVAEGRLDEETLEGTQNQVAQIGVDITKVLNAMHVPDDAGEYREGLERILQRIPDGWGRCIRCDKGWYGLIVQLNEAISALAPDYEVNQVKEKYGTLRYYYETNFAPGACCQRFAEEHGERPAWDARVARILHGEEGDWTETELEQAAALALYKAQLALHEETEEHLENLQEQEGRSSVIEALVDAAEERSARTCETCGAPGVLMHSAGWYKTLCTTCAGDGFAHLLASDTE